MTSFKNEIEILGKKIGVNYPTYFVADIAANHDGDIERAKDLIFLAAEAGADAAKFQHFDAPTIVSDLGFKNLGGQISHQANWEKSVFEVYQDASVDLAWTDTLIETCTKAGITFFTTPYSLNVVDFMKNIVPAYKIGSGDITWLDMVEKVASTQKPYMIATGASTADEVHRALELAIKINPNIVLMQCNTNYTASLDNFKYIQLNVLKTYQNMYPGMLIGLSDHTPGHSTVLGAIALGARVIEKHFTDNVKREGPDHAFSMDPLTWREMVDRTRELEQALGNGIKKIEENEIDTAIVQRRSMRANKDLKNGSFISIDDFIALRPCPEDAIQPWDFKKFIGKKIIKNIKEGDCLKIIDVDFT